MTIRTTNPRKIIFTTRDEYLTFIRFWKTLASSKTATARDFMLYALIQGTRLNQAFTPMKRQIRIDSECNGDANLNIKRSYFNLSCYLVYQLCKDTAWKDALPENVQKLLLQLCKTIKDSRNYDNIVTGNYVIRYDDNQEPIVEIVT